MRVMLRLAAVTACAAAPVAAQTESNRYLPISSWAMPYVEHLARAGVLRGLDPLTRPLRTADLARALAAVDTQTISGSALSLTRLLAQELNERADTVRWRLEANVALLGASDPRRWALRPAGEDGVFPEAGLTASLEMPHLALVTHPRIDNRLKHDPDYTGKKDRVISGRNDEAYLTASWRYLDVFYGLADRNWGSPAVEGLLLSNSAYGFDHLMLRLGPRRLRLELLATQLDTTSMWDSPVQLQRYLSLHRLVVIPSEALAFSLFEGALYAGNGLLNRSPEPWYLNALNLFLLAQYNDVPTSNALVGADVSARVRGARLFAQLYLDDLQVDDDTPGDREPPGYGFALAASGGAMAGSVSWSAFYTRVTNTAYRTPAREEQYSMRRVGIARNFTDYDQATLLATLAPGPRALVTGELSYLRQGEGDLRERFPPVEAYDTLPTFLTGAVERTVRLALQAGWVPFEGLSFSADLGRHFVSNAGHVAGASGDRWVWRIRGEIRRRLSGALRW